MNDSSLPQTVIVYQSADSNLTVEIPADFERRTIWLTQKKIALLLGLTVPTVNYHIDKFRQMRSSTGSRCIRRYLIDVGDGRMYDTEHYDLTVVAYIGFSAKASERVVAFQDWVGEQLEKALTQKAVMPTTIQGLLAVVQRMADMEAEQMRIAEENKLLAAGQAELTRQQAEHSQHLEAIDEKLLDKDFYSVLQWCQKQRIPLTVATNTVRSMWGNAAIKLSRERGVEIKDKDTPEGFNLTNRYHKSILLEICVPKHRLHGQLPLMGDGK